MRVRYVACIRTRTMMKRHNPEVYNTTANPSLPRTNSVDAFVIAFVILGLVLMAAIHWLPSPFRLSPPEISYSPDHVNISTVASNNTDEATTAQIRVMLVRWLSHGKLSPITRREMDRRDVSVTLEPHSTAPVTVTIPIPLGSFGYHAELEVLSRR